MNKHDTPVAVATPATPLPPHPKYTIERRHRLFRIIRWKQVGAHWEGEEVGEFADFEMARRALYDLNGWNYKPKTTEKRNGNTHV